MSTKNKSEKLQCLRFRDLVRLNIFTNRMTLRRWVQQGRFPAPVKLGENTHVWLADEVEKFLEDRERVTYSGKSQGAA